MKIIVEAMGHVNYDHLMDSDIKGLFNLTDDLATEFKWNIYKVPIDKSILQWNNYKWADRLEKSEAGFAGREVFADRGPRLL